MKKQIKFLNNKNKIITRYINFANVNNIKYLRTLIKIESRKLKK